MNCMLFIPYFCLVLLFCIWICVCIYVLETNDLVKQTCSGEKLYTPTHIWCLVNEGYQLLLKQLFWRLIKNHVVSPYMIFRLKSAQQPCISISFHSHELFINMTIWPTVYLSHLRIKYPFQLFQGKPGVPEYTCFALRAWSWLIPIQQAASQPWEARLLFSWSGHSFLDILDNWLLLPT